MLHTILPKIGGKSGFSSCNFIFVYLILVFGCLGLSSCAYRFTNSHISPPEGIETIAVEAIYDTSREVLAHEQLWEQVQAAIIKDGNLRLTNQSNADALLRLHITKARISPAGESRDNGNGSDGKDPEVFNRETPPSPHKMRRLTQAGKFKDSAIMTFQVKAEVISLRTKSILLKKKYNLSTGRYYATYQGDSKNNWFLRYVEAGDAAFNSASEKLADKIVRDLLVR